MCNSYTPWIFPFVHASRPFLLKAHAPISISAKEVKFTDVIIPLSLYKRPRKEQIGKDLYCKGYGILKNAFSANLVVCHVIPCGITGKIIIVIIMIRRRVFVKLFYLYGFAFMNSDHWWHWYAWKSMEVDMYTSSHQTVAAIGVGSRISQRRGRWPQRGGANLLFGQFFAKTAWKWRNFGPGDARPP